MRLPLSRIARVAAAAALLTSLAACGSVNGSDGKPAVVASFYPLQYIAEEIGGEHVSVTNLTAPGAEPHDLELGPKQVAEMSDADLVLYLKGFQPAVDDAVTNQASDAGMDVAESTKLIDAAEHGEEQHDHGHGHDHGETDPHVWLDPTKTAEIADAVAERLSEADPDHAADFEAGAKALKDKLSSLDTEYTEGLADCKSRDMVTSHAAFGYLAHKYDLHQIAVSGLSPEAEPDSKALKEVSDYVAEHDITTVFYETLVDPKVANTVAEETGAQTAVLDPLEGLQDGNGDDYISIMKSNLDTLRGGLQCQ